VCRKWNAFNAVCRENQPRQRSIAIVESERDGLSGLLVVRKFWGGRFRQSNFVWRMRQSCAISNWYIAQWEILPMSAWVNRDLSRRSFSGSHQCGPSAIHCRDAPVDMSRILRSTAAASCQRPNLKWMRRGGLQPKQPGCFCIVNLTPPPPKIACSDPRRS
jgi:hypothetical protein